MQLRYGLVGADFSDFHPASDRVTGPNWSGEVPIDIQKDSSGFRQFLCDNCIEDRARNAALHNDLSESGGARRLEVVVQWITITADLGEPFDVGCRDGATHFRSVTHLGSAIRPDLDVRIEPVQHTHH
jgi:hypothetical protein